MKKNKTFYISTPIYYPSGNLHIGHLLTTTLAWVYTNYKKQQGYDTYFVTGIDEHGQKIEKKALSLNLEPQAYVDGEEKKFKDLWTKLDINYDFFSRTTNEKHKKTIQKVFEKMFEKGYIYKGNYEGLYSINDEEFLTKTQAIHKDGKYYHPTSNHLLVEIKEESYFFCMSKFGSWIKEYFLNNPEFLTNKAIEKELINNFLDKGLEDLSITRISFDWGIALDKFKSNDKKHTHIIYVWLDALFNYLTALQYLEDDDLNYQKFWKNGTERVHVLGKEISRFHAIYWPIFLKSLDLNLPTKEVIHSWIITPEGKMSKSKGNVIEPIPLVEKYGAEEIKYFFSSQINIDNDFSYSDELLVNVLNSDLANNFGNLLNRVVKMVNQSFSNGTKYDEKNLQEIDKNIYKLIFETYENYKLNFDNFHIDKASRAVINLSSKLNEYIDLTTPWSLKNDPIRLNSVLNTLLNGLYAINFMLSVIMPKKCNIILGYLNQSKFDEKLLFDWTKFDNKKVEVKEILFPRIK